MSKFPIKSTVAFVAVILAMSGCTIRTSQLEKQTTYSNEREIICTLAAGGIHSNSRAGAFVPVDVLCPYGWTPELSDLPLDTPYQNLTIGDQVACTVADATTPRFWGNGTDTRTVTRKCHQV